MGGIGADPAPTCPPLVQVLALGGELEDAGVAVAVGDEDAASVDVHSHVGGLAEVAAVASGDEGLPQGQQDPVPAVTAHLEDLRGTAGGPSGSCWEPHTHTHTHLVQSHVSQPVVVVLVRADPMRQVEPAGDTSVRTGPDPRPRPPQVLLPAVRPPRQLTCSCQRPSAPSPGPGQQPGQWTAGWVPGTSPGTAAAG